MSRENVEALRTLVGRESQGFQAAVNDFDAAAAIRLGVNETDLRCLEILLTEEGETAPGKLAERLGLTTGSVTAMLDRLERQGYLTRSPDPADRRRLLVRITPQASEKVFVLYGPLLAEGEELVTRFSAQELQTVAEYLRSSRELYERHLAHLREQ